MQGRLKISRYMLILSGLFSKRADSAGHQTVEYKSSFFFLDIDIFDIVVVCDNNNTIKLITK